MTYQSNDYGRTQNTLAESPQPALSSALKERKNYIAQLRSRRGAPGVRYDSGYPFLLPRFHPGFSASMAFISLVDLQDLRRP